MCITSCELPLQDLQYKHALIVLFMTRAPHINYEMIRNIKEMIVEVVEY